MSATRRVFFGSLFEFSNTGIEEVLDGIRDQFSDPDAVPFMSYDAKNHLFSFEVEANDYESIPIMIAHIETYTALHGRKPNEPLESDRLRPIDGTAFVDEASAAKTHQRERNLLFDISDSSSDEEEPDEDTYWKPECGNIFIVSKDLVSELSDATGCLLVPYPAEQKIRLVQGNQSDALEKLQRLEHVLNISKHHRFKSGSRVNANLLISARDNSKTTMRFTRPIQPLCGFDRIILHPAQLDCYNQLMLGEVRVWQNNQRVKPLNLDLEGVSITASSGPSARISGVPLPMFGNARNAEPRPPSNESSQLSGEVQRVNSPTKFLGHKDTERVEEWRGNIDLNAAPTLLPVEPVAEPEVKPGRRRLVESDSDSDVEVAVEDEVQIEVVVEPVPLSLELKDQPETKPGRRRLVESDSESDLEATTMSRQKKSVDSDSRKDKTREDQSVAKLTSTRFKPSGTQQPVSNKSKKRPQAIATTTALKGNNMFALIDPDDDVDQQESSSEVLSSGQSSGNIKQLNVTFEEPEKDPPTAPVSMRQFTSPAKSEKSPSSPFDAAKYGLKSHMVRSRSGDSNTNQSPVRGGSKTVILGRGSSGSQLSTKAEPFRPSLSRPESHHGRGGLRGGGGGANHSQRRQKDLIDVVDGEVLSETLMPPPGFDYRSVDRINQSADLNTRAQRVVPDDQAVLSPGNHESTSNRSASAFGSTNHAAGPLEFNPQYTVPKRNINYIQHRVLATLEAQMIPGDEVPEVAEQDMAAVSPNRIKKHDEHSTRKYHKTMSQKMAKPAKGKSTAGKQETKAQKDARIERVKAELYGNTVTAKAPAAKPQSTSTRPDSSDAMSARKRQLIRKNQTMADMHQDVVADIALQDTAKKLADELKPILEATRAIKGVIRVEIQFGQDLVLKNSHVDEGRLYKTKEWEQLLGGKSRGDTEVIFTNILTTNGHDIDRMLDMKADTESSRLWGRLLPEAVSTSFEFTCEDRSGNLFLLVLDQDGEHYLNKPESTIAQIALHAPEQIWDACVVVSATTKFYRPSDEVLAGAKQFKESLYIPGGNKVAVYFRLPANNAFAVRAIVVKRVSTHQCLLHSRDSIQLRVTEVKVLAHSSHPTDKKLYRSYESAYEIMLAESRLHYEVAIADADIEKGFEHNSDIEIGQQAPVGGTSDTILTFAQAHGLVEVTSHMLEQIDWVGAQNHGTLRRIFENTAEQRALVVNTLPPNINRSLPIPMGTTAPPTIVPQPTILQQHSRTGSNNNVVTSMEAPQTIVRQLHGVRANTAAELYQDHSTGELFYYGLGGARVPVVSTEELASPRLASTGPVLPDDSASQIGDTRKKLASTAKATSGGGARDDKPAGFW